MKFIEIAPSRPIRIGLEFEAGNIASSFRALSKLNFLYTKGLIDFGIFITSIDKKTTATKIWPASNRNGSFEELRARQYKENILIPMLEIGFQPDSDDTNCQYLAKTGELFIPEVGGRTLEVDGATFQEHRIGRKSAWKKID